MAQLSFAYPDGYTAAMAFALKRLLGADGAGLTPAQMFQEVVKRTLLPHLRAVMLNASSGLATASDTLAAAQAAAEAAAATRKAQEQAVIAAVNAAFGVT